MKGASPEDPSELPLSVETAATERVASGSVQVQSWSVHREGDLLCGGRFAVMRRIGEGGMGVVHQAFDRERGVKVAIKTLHELDPASIYQLKNEFRSLAGLVHPNLVTLHELFEDGGRYFFSMDLVHGVRFDDWVRTPLGYSEVRLRAAFSQLIAAVSALHDVGKFHCDLKPSNVLVTPEGHVVVLDFGLVTETALGPDGKTLDDLSICGTPEYLAPEAALGVAATAARDYYALGVMLFEALTGRVPFVGTVHEILTDKQRLDAPPLWAAAPDAVIPADLERVCASLLSRDPTRRSLAGFVAHDGRPSPRQIREVPGQAAVLCGRATELAQLSAAYDASVLGAKPVVMLVAGESGIGKTALIEAFLRPLREADHALVLSGRCFERESVPFKGFDAVVDQLSRYLRKLSPQQASALLPRDAFALRRLFPVLGRVAVLAEAPNRELSDQLELRRRAFVALGELLGRIRDRRPVLLHLDDLQWSDADSTQLLLHLALQPDAPRLMLVLSHRSEEMRDHPCIRPLYEVFTLHRRLDVHQLQLGALSADAAEQLLTRHNSSASREVLESAGGNPFFLGELARFGQRTHELPASALHSILQRRVAALAEPLRRLLEVLAVAGRPLPLALACAAGGEESSRALFDVLRSENLARATGSGTDIECFHDRVREAVVAALSEQAVRAYHSALAKALSSSPIADPERVASHLLGAGDSPGAAVQFARAAERAQQELGFDRAARLYALSLQHGRFDPDQLNRTRTAHATVLALAGRGLEAADVYLQLSRTSRGGESIELKQRAAEQCLYAGALQRGKELLTEALTARGLAVPRGTAATVASIAYHDARLRWRRYRWQPGATSDPARASQIDALRRAANALLRIDPLRAIELGLRGALMALRWGDETAAGHALVNIMIAAVIMDRDEKDLDRVVRAAEKVAGVAADPVMRGWWFYGCGLIRLHGARYDPEGALQDFERCIELLSGPVMLEVSYNRGWCEWFRAETLVHMGRFEEASVELLAHFDEAVHRSDSSIVPMWGGRIGVLTSIAADDTARAEQMLQKARNIWAPTEPTLQEEALHEGAVYLQLHHGHAREALSSAEAWYARLKSSPMWSSRWFRSDAQFLCGIAALALCRSTESAAERAHTIKRINELARESNLTILHAGAACARGDRRAAIAALKAVDARGIQPQLQQVPASWTTLYARIARRRLVELEVGPTAKQQLSQIDNSLTNGGVRNPARFAATLLPGFEISENVTR